MLTDNEIVMANLNDAVYSKKYNKTEKQKCKKSLIRSLLYLVPEIMLHSLDVNFPISKNFTSILDINASLNKHNSILETNIVYSNNSMEKKRLTLQAPKKFVSQAGLAQRHKQAKSFYWKVIAHFIEKAGAFEDIQSNFYTSLLSFFLFKPKSTSLTLSPYGQSSLLSSSVLKCSSKYMQCFYSMVIENGSFLLQTCSFLPDFRIYILSSKVASQIIVIKERIDGLKDEKYSLCPNIFLKKLFNIQASGDYKFCILGCKYVKLCLSFNHAIYLQPLLKLDTKLKKIESKICQLKLECKPDFKIENNIRKNFTIILKWLEMVEKMFLSVKKAENFEAFKDSCLSFSKLVADLQIYANLSAVCYKQLMLLRCHLWCVEHLENDMKHISDRLEYIKLFSISIQKDFDLYLQCFQHLHNVLQCLAWLKEVLVVMGVKVVFINEEDIAKKLLGIKNLEEIFISKAAKVDKVIIKGKKLLSKGFLIPFYYNFCLTQLEEEWIRVKQLVKVKIYDSKNFKTNWIIFNQKLNQIIENIGNIEILFFNLKSMRTFSQAINDDLMKFSLKCISMLLEQANHLNSIYVLHECVLKHKLSNDLNYMLRQKLENVFFIKNSLKFDLETYTNILISDCSKETFQESCDKLIKWFHDIDSVLNSFWSVKSKDIKEKHKGKPVIELVNNIPLKIFSSFPATYKAEILRESWVHQELFFRLTQLMKWLERKKKLVYLSDKIYIGNFQNASNYKLEQKVQIDPMTTNKLDLSTPGEKKCYSCFAKHLEDKICCFSHLKKNSKEEISFHSSVMNSEQKLPSSCITKTSSSECFQKEKYFQDVIIEYEYIIDEFEVLHIQTIEVCDDEFFAEETKFQMVASKKNNTMIKSEEKSRKESKNKFFSSNKSQQCVPMGIFEPDLSDCSHARFNIEKLPPYSLQPSSGKEINKMHYSERTTNLLRSAQDQLYENLSTCLSEGVTEFDVFEKISDENNNTKVEKYGKLKCSIESLNAELKEFFKTLEDGNISYLPNFCQSWNIISSLYRQVSNSKHEFGSKSKKCGTKDLQKMLHSIEQNLFEACELCESHLLPMIAGIYSNLIVISASFEQIEDQFQTYDTLFVVEKDEIDNIVSFNENVQKYIDNALILVNVWRQLEIHEETFDKIIGNVLFLCYRIDSLLENLLSKQLFVEDEYMQNVQDLHTEVAYISNSSVCELSETLLESHFKQLFCLQSRVELHKNLDLAPEMLLTIQRALEAIKLNIHKNRDRSSSASSSPAQHKLINVKPQHHGLTDFKGYKGKSPRNTPLNEKKNYNNAIHTKNGVSSFHFKPFHIPNDDYEMNCVLVDNFCDEPEASCNSKNNGLLLNDSSNVSWASFINIAENSESKFSEPSSFSDSLETLDAPLSLDKGVSITPLTEVNSENIPVECTDVSLDWDFVDDVDSFRINPSTPENQKNQSFENQNQKQFLPSLNKNLDLSEIKFKCHEKEILPDSLYTLKTYQVIMEPDDDSYSVNSLNKPFKNFNQKSNKTSTHSVEVSEYFEPNKETNCYETNHDHSEIEVRSFEVATNTFVEDVLASVLNDVNLKPDMTGSLINAEHDGPLQNVDPVESFKTNKTLNLIQDESLISFNNLSPHTCPIDIFLKLPELEQIVNEEKNSEETTLKNHISSAETILMVENNNLSTKVIETIDDSNHEDFDKILLAQMYNQVSQPLSPKLVTELPDSVSLHPDNSGVQSCNFSIVSNEFSEPTESAIVSNDFSEPTKSVYVNCLQTHKSCLNKSKESQKSRGLSILEELEDCLSNEVVGIKSDVSSNIDGKPIFYANSVDSICVDECNTECGDDLGRPLILPSLNQSVSRIENLKHAKVNMNVIAMDFTVSCSADTIATPYVSSYNITDQDMNLYVELTKAEEMQEIDQLFKNATLELQNSLNTSMKCIPDSAEEQSTALQYKYESLTLPRASSPISMANCLVKAVQTKEISNNFEDFEDEQSFLSTNDSSFYVSLLMKQEKSYPIDNNFADQPYKNLADPMLNEFEQKAQICMESMIHISNMMSIQSQNEEDDENYFMTKLKLLSYFGFQQSNNDSLNIIGKQIQEAYGVELKDRIQEKLDVVNIYWKDLQDKAIYVECMNSKGLRSAQDEDVSNQLSNKRVPSNTLNEFNGFAESWQQVDDYQIQYAKIFFLLTSYNNRLTIENIESEEKTRTKTDVEKLKNDYYSAQYLIFDMCSQVSLLEKLGQIYDEIESPSDSLKYHHTHIFDFWEHILHKVASKTEELYKFLKSQQKELSNHDLCRRWLFELESCLNDTKDLLLLQPTDFKCETIKMTFAYLAKTLETNLRMVKLITLNQSANVDKCSDLYIDVIHIMQFDPNIVNTLETKISQNKFIPSIISSPEFFILSSCRNQKYSLVHGISFFEKEMESFLTYLSETIKTVESAQVDIASDVASNSTTIITNITRFQTFLQNIKVKELPLKHVYFELQKLNPELDERYAKMIKKSEKAYQKCLAILQTLVCVFLLIKSVNKQQKHLITWLLKFEKHLEYLVSKPERCIDDAMRKLVNISNIARRFHVKSSTKNKAIEDTNRLSDLRNDANKQDFVFRISNDWNRIEKLLEKEKNRLDSLTSNWKELKFLAQNLEQDVARFLLTVDTSIEHITVEHITLERELLMKVKKQLRKKEKVREQLKVLREKIITHILENSCSVIDERLSVIDSMWFELQSKISDRLRVLSDVKNKIEWVEISEAMREVTKCISSSEELMEIYASPVSLTPREIEEGLLLLSDSLFKLEKVQPIIHRLDNYDTLLMKDNFREQFILINNKYELLCKNINERLNLLKIYLENIRAHENFIIECEKQLDELNTVIDKIKHLTFTDAYNDEYKEQLKITDEAIRNISNRIHDVESETENRNITDFTRARINALNDRLKSSKLKFLEIEAKAKSYSEYGTLNNELSNVEDFLNESKLFLSSLMGANIYDLPFLSKRFKEIQLELPRKLAYLENLKEKLTSTELSDTENNLLFLNETLSDEMRKFGVLLDKKQNDFEIAVSSIRQFELDYNELEKWLNEKEMEYDSLLKHAHLSSDIDKVIDSCKKLQADLPVFSTFSSSMTSLLSNNNLSSGFAEISLNQLNVRFDVLQEQTNLLCKKFCQIKQNYSSIIKLFEKTSSFVESCKAQTLDYEEYSFSVQSNLPQCIEMQKELQEILKLHDLDSYIEVQASTCLEKIETTYSQLTKELLIIEQVNKLLTSFENEFKKILADIELLNELIQKNHSIDKVQDFKENVNRKSESIHEINKNIMNLIRDAIWASDIRCRQESCMSLLIKKLNQILISDEQNNKQQFEHLIDADESAKTILIWLEDAEAKLIDMGNRIKLSNVAILKACFEELKNLKSEKLQHQKIYNDLMRQFNDMHESSELEKINPAISIQGLWSKIEKLISRCFDDIKEVLLIWAEYTENIKGLIYWLRSSENIIKQPLHKLSAKQLNNEFFILQKISNEYDARHASQTTLKPLVARLSKLTLHEDKLLLKQQLTCFNQLWAATKSSLNKKKVEIEKLIDWLKSFSHQKKIILAWLEEVENSIFLSVSPDKHRGGTLQIYKSDVIRYDKVREQLKLIAVKVISHAPACEFSEDINCFIVELDNRWRSLCEKLGLAYQGVEEALFLLKLLEEMLNMLEKWLHDISKRIEQIELYTCNIDSIHIYIQNLEVMINEFINREKDFVSVCELCKKIQKSPEACSYAEDLKVLLECSEGFKIKWHGIREKCRMYKTILENREEVYRQWENTADAIKVWLVQHTNNNSTIANVQAYDTDNYRILDLFNQLQNCRNYLLRNNCDNSSLKITKATEELSESLYCVNYMFLTFQCSSNDINNNISNSDNKCQENYVKYLKTEQEVENWLCEIEIQMIQLRPYIFEQDEKALFEIRRIKDEMEKKSSIVEELNLQTETMNGYVEENIMEINHRYQKALKDLKLWISNYDNDPDLTS
ncbi:uncharacterized protein LOC100206390 isoform X5 [Hydra vulgaris]|uniref:uncharacterized protein LOC100206390 isoform X5 n=1 Tax=Hydra vulgaris TaxID=6087 RepID=UPI001F5EB80E|nr:uncharacterized protein LOC100206390 isoform X2 [Hydra vulgaris]